MAAIVRPREEVVKLPESCGLRASSDGQDHYENQALSIGIFLYVHKGHYGYATVPIADSGCSLCDNPIYFRADVPR